MNDSPEQPTQGGCLVDHRPAPNARLCNGCLDALKAELRAIPWLVEQLGITLTRQARVGERNGPRSTETPLPFHLGASIDLETLRDGLGMWAAAVAKQRGIEVDAAPEPTALAKWLLRWAGEVAQHEDAGELHGDILAMTRAARKTIDLAPDRRFLGPCDECGEDLYIWASNGRLPEFVHCATDGCEARYPMAERRAYLLEAAYDRFLTAAEMSRAIRELIPGKPISPNVISQWAARGLRTVDGLEQLPKHPPHHLDPHKRPRYKVEEVISFARKAMGAQDEPKSA